MIYSDKLKSPKWQKKRLEILNLHGFKCDKCKSEIKTLHVHHRFYLKGRQPWEYDNDVFQVLCEDCHEETHTPKEKIIEVIPKKYEEIILRLETLGNIDLVEFIFILENMCSDPGTFEQVTGLLSFGYNYGHMDSALEYLNDKQKIENLEIGLCMLQNRILDLENK